MVTRGLRVLAERMVLRQVPVVTSVCGHRASDGRRNHSVGLVDSVPRHYDKHYLTGPELLQALLAWYYLAASWQYARDGDQVELLDSGIPQCELERLQLVLVPPYALREEELLWNHAHEWIQCAIRVLKTDSSTPISHLRIQHPRHARARSCLTPA